MYPLQPWSLSLAPKSNANVNVDAKSQFDGLTLFTASLASFIVSRSRFRARCWDYSADAVKCRQGLSATNIMYIFPQARPFLL